MLMNKNDPESETQIDYTRLMDITEKNMQMTPDEENLVNKFLSRFEIMQKGQQSSCINLSLVNKVFPKIFTHLNVAHMDLINF